MQVDLNYTALKKFQANLWWNDLGLKRRNFVVVVFFILQQAGNPIDYSDSFFKIIKEWSLISLRKSMP